MNFKNLAENLIIVIVSALIGGSIGYVASTSANKQTIELLRPSIEEAIRKETTSITNEFKTEIKKLKNKGTGNVVLEIEPVLKTAIKQKSDSIKPIKKKGFFKRIFG
ncbi:hypothetical protein [Tenacibaculum piscium]|uniref:hypothetical protein n=1 Tax=Tenacibaculum piscium TaxID=1458515 RepID=UPI001F2C9DEC|nr:hypothetical protein [Tenacibaculum piscium]